MTTRIQERLERLVKEATRGNRESFSEIVRHLMKPVVALAYRMTGDKDAAADLAQDTFVTAWQKLATFRGEAKFESWLYRITANKVLDYLDSRARFRRVADESRSAIKPAVASPAEMVEREELRSGVLEFMQTLPEQQRLVFDLRFYSELSFAEIAGVMGRAVGTVKTNYREAVAKLREHAKERGWH